MNFNAYITFCDGRNAFDLIGERTHISMKK